MLRQPHAPARAGASCSASAAGRDRGHREPEQSACCPPTTRLIAQDPTPPAGQFLGARLLFLLTVPGGEMNRVLVDEHRYSDALVESLNSFPLGPPPSSSKSKSDQSVPVATAEQLAALLEHLRVVFNLAMFYPQLVAVAAVEERQQQRERERRASEDATARAASPALGVSSTMARSKSDDAASIRSATGLIGRNASVDRDRAATSSGAILASSASSVHRKVKGLFSRSPRLGVDSPDGSPNSPRRRRWRSNDGDAVPETGLSSRLAPAVVRVLLGLPAQADGTPTLQLSAAINALLQLPSTANVFLASPSSFIHPLPPLPSAGLKSTPSPLPPLPARLLALLDAITRVSCALPGEPTVSPDDPRLVRKRGQDESGIDASIVAICALLCEMIHNEPGDLVERGLRSRLLADDMCARDRRGDTDAPGIAPSRPTSERI